MRDSELIELLRRRDERGMTALMSRYGPLIRYIITPILPGHHDREECISEISMRVWEKFDLYDNERGNLKSWLTALVRNAALNFARKNRQSMETGELPREYPSPDLGPEARVIRQERIRALEEALRSLTSLERSIFYRKYYYMQPVLQIASELGMTERAVEGRLYRLKGRLRKKLGGEEIE